LKQQLFLDCDGVLADFDTGIVELTGMSGPEFEQTHGSHHFWKTIQQSNKFFENLPLMDGAMELFNAVKHLRPIILTGCPLGIWAAQQKLNWRNMNFPGIPMVTCMSRDKVDFCQPGDILIDDMLKHSQRWIDGEGTFVHYVNSVDTLEQLTTLRVI
jgi:beta-phosphoglucomutase-like phosphatase (HAD superfamily)